MGPCPLAQPAAALPLATLTTGKLSCPWWLCTSYTAALVFGLGTVFLCVLDVEPGFQSLLLWEKLKMLEDPCFMALFALSLLSSRPTEVEREAGKEEGGRVGGRKEGKGSREVANLNF